MWSVEVDGLEQPGTSQMGNALRRRWDSRL
jgi:hypothetical protein